MSAMWPDKQFSIGLFCTSVGCSIPREGAVGEGDLSSDGDTDGSPASLGGPRGRQGRERGAGRGNNIEEKYFAVSKGKYFGSGPIIPNSQFYPDD